MMNCQTARNAIDDLLDRELPESESASVWAHLDECRACQALLGQEQKLRAALRSLPAVMPPPGFVDRALHKAAMARPVPARPGGTWPSVFALAATLVLGIAVGMYFAQSPALGPQADQQLLVTMSTKHSRNIELAFDSGSALQDVSVTLYLPEQIEIAGFPGQRSIQWHTDMDAGRNRLSLPLVAHGGSGGILVAELAHGGIIKRFEVRVEVSPQAGGLQDKPQTISI